MSAKIFLGEVGGFNQIPENPTDNSERPSVVDSAEKIKMKYLHMLDTDIQQDLGFTKLCSSLNSIEKKIRCVATQLSPELLRTEFKPREKWGYSIMANFKSGWSLTENQSY